jgi:hypothetical protein
MTRRPRRTKPDSNHADFADLRDYGFLMIDIHDLGGQALDWLCAGENFKTGRIEMTMIEVKPDPKATFTPDEFSVLDLWPNVAMIAYSIEDVLRRYGRIE